MSKSRRIKLGGGWTGTIGAEGSGGMFTGNDDTDVAAYGLAVRAPWGGKSQCVVTGADTMADAKRAARTWISDNAHDCYKRKYGPLIGRFTNNDLQFFERLRFELAAKQEADDV